MLTYLEHALPSKKAIRGQIATHGRRNSLMTVNEDLLTVLLGHPPTNGVCYIRFVPGRQLQVNKYHEATLSLKAAVNSLNTIIRYLEQNEDPLLTMHWNHFLKFAEFGNDVDMDICKDILTFVKCLEKKGIPLSTLQENDLRAMCRYSSIEQYPKDYVMRFDIINEYDRYIPEEDMWGYQEEYRTQFLNVQPYNTGHYNFIMSLYGAIKLQTEYMVEKGIAENYFKKFFKPDESLLTQSNDTRCAAGSKRFDFWNILTCGVAAELSPIINEHIDTINELYGLNIQYPRISIDGMTLKEYLPELIIQEDPKKRRIAYKSNPLLDIIGAVAMDASKYMFNYFPNIQCGRKRLTNSDWMEDLSRYGVIKQLYQDAKKAGIVLCSTDLSSCTEHLNMVDYKNILTTRLKMIRDQLRLPYTDKQIEKRVDLCCNMLYQTGITLSKDPEYGRVYYMLKGQMAGVRMSFHAMTDELSTIQVQALLNTIPVGGKEDVLNWCLENGDDGVIPEYALQEFSRLLTLTTETPEVINREKSYSSADTQFVEFCKTTYFDFPNEPITGYRYCSLYKLTSDPRDVGHLTDGTHEYERKLFIWFLENWEHEKVEDMIDWELEEYNNFYATYLVLTAKEPQRFYDAILLWRAMQVQYVTNYGLVAENIALPQAMEAALPEGMSSITPKNTYYLVKDGNYVMHTDFRLLDALDKKVSETFRCGTLTDWLINPYYYNQAKQQYQDLTGLEWEECCTRYCAVDTPACKVIPLPKSTADQLGIPSTEYLILTAQKGSRQLTHQTVQQELQYTGLIAEEDSVTKANIVPVKMGCIQSKMVMPAENLESLNMVNSPVIRPIITLDDTIEVMRYYDGITDVMPTDYNSKVVDLPQILSSRTMKAMVKKRIMEKYQIQIQWVPRSWKWNWIQ